MARPTDDEQDSDDDDDLAEGEEICPVCGVVVDPGAMETCAHFVGSLWDGDIIWSDDFDALRDSWNEVSSLIDSLEEAGVEKDTLFSRAAHAGIEQALLEMADPSQWTAADAACELIDFSFAEYRETNGMLSGGGQSLYHDNPRTMLELANRYGAAARQLKSLFSMHSPEPDPPPSK